MSCTGCGSTAGIEPSPALSQEQIDATVDQVLAVSLADARRHGGVCPLCGHPEQPTRWMRLSSSFPPVLLVMLFACGVLLIAALWAALRRQGGERSSATAAALEQLRRNPQAVQLIGLPMKLEPGVGGGVTRDETGWSEAHLKLLVSGPRGEASLDVRGDKADDQWHFNAFEVVVEKQHKKLDLVSGRTVTYEPDVYVDVHTMAARTAEYMRTTVPPPTLDGTFPCVSASLASLDPVAKMHGMHAGGPSLGRCAMPLGLAGASKQGDLDRVEVDLRDGSFVMRQTDLSLGGVFPALLTRSYRSDDWLAQSRSHAFGNNSNHPFDIAPLGDRNPYTYQVLALEDGDLLFFERVSKGTGYADAVYQHSETSSRFYKATQSWNGEGWTLRLADGSEMRFPESYNATSLAQGAAILLRDPAGNELRLVRDRRRNLTGILAPQGHSIRLDYGDQARIVRARDDRGAWSAYTYSTGGMLLSAIHSSGRERHYTYEGPRLMTISNERGQTLLRNSYEDRFLVGQQFADGTVLFFHYKTEPGRSWFRSATVTMPDGTEHTLDTSSSVPAWLRRQE